MTLDDFIKEAKEISGKTTRGPYTIERVDHEPDQITYEVSSPKKGFHVLFCEYNCLEKRISAKNQAEFYAFSRNNFDKLIKIVEIQNEALATLKEMGNDIRTDNSIRLPSMRFEGVQLSGI